jgi:hypothetical protein
MNITALLRADAAPISRTLKLEKEPVMSDIDEFDDLYGSKYLSVADLKGGEPRLKIGKVEVADLRDKTGTTKRRYVTFFEGIEKGLVINITNAKKLAEAYGKQSAKWIGQIVELYSEDTSLGKGVRVRPMRKPAIPAQPNSDLDDAIPI